MFPVPVTCGALAKSGSETVAVTVAAVAIAPMAGIEIVGPLLSTFTVELADAGPTSTTVPEFLEVFAAIEIPSVPLPVIDDNFTVHVDAVHGSLGKTVFTALAVFALFTVTLAAVR